MRLERQNRFYVLFVILALFALFLALRAASRWLEREGTGRAIGEAEGCGTTTADAVDAPYRVGFNMIRVLPAPSPFDTPAKVVEDMAQVGAQGMRQIQDADLGWFSLYRGGPWDDPESYDFGAADEFLLNDIGIAVIPTLFQIGPATAGRAFGVDCPDEGASDPEHCWQPYTPDGAVLDVREPAVAAAARGYVRVVAEHYRDTDIRYLEVLNEPERYRHQDLGVGYRYTWEPQRYVELLALVDAALAEVDPGYQIVMGGLVYYDNQEADGRQELWEDYFDKVLGHGGGAYIDVVNFHYYGAYPDLPGHIAEIRGVLEGHGVLGAPLWMTEVGSSATTASEREQAADIVRMFTIAFGNGVALANWHTHISSHDGIDGWGGYGTRTQHGRQYLSWFAFQEYAARYGAFRRCVILSEDDGLWAYEFEPGAGLVAWSDRAGATLDVSGFLDAGEVRVTELVPDSDHGFHSWEQDASEPVGLTEIPCAIEAARR